MVHPPVPTRVHSRLMLLCGVQSQPPLSAPCCWDGIRSVCVSIFGWENFFGWKGQTAQTHLGQFQNWAMKVLEESQLRMPSPTHPSRISVCEGGPPKRSPDLWLACRAAATGQIWVLPLHFPQSSAGQLHLFSMCKRWPPSSPLKYSKKTRISFCNLRRLSTTVNRLSFISCNESRETFLSKVRQSCQKTGDSGSYTQQRPSQALGLLPVLRQC